MNTPACFRPSTYFHSSSSKPAKYGIKRLVGGTVLLLFLLVPGWSAFAQTPLTPSRLSFGSQVLNQSSAAMSATLKNAQDVPLSISGIAINGGRELPDYRDVYPLGAGLAHGHAHGYGRSAHKSCERGLDGAKAFMRITIWTSVSAVRLGSADLEVGTFTCGFDPHPPGLRPLHAGTEEALGAAD